MKPKAQVEYRPIKDLKELPGNPRIIKKDQFEKLKQSIKDNADYFEARPIILSDRTGELIILAGNQRYKAAKAIGMTEVPTILLPNLTEEREKEIIIRDNVENGEWDWDKLANEWDAATLADWGVQMPDWASEAGAEIIEDEAPEPETDKPAKSKLGEIYQLGDHYLMCGDSTNEKDVDRLMSIDGGLAADMVMTDPPYNVNVSNSDGLTIENDNMDSLSFNTFLNKAFSNLSKWLKAGGAFYIWYGDSEDVAFRTAATDNGLLIKQCLIWVKNSFNLGRQDYQWRHEPCLYGWKEGEGHYFVYDRTQDTVIEQKPIDFDSLTLEEATKLLKNIYESDMPTTVIKENKPKKNDLHPTMKPLGLIGQLIKNSSEKGELVLDLFGGSGSTLIACEQLGRKCRMMEFDPHYVDAIIDRYEAYTGKKAVKLEK